MKNELDAAPNTSSRIFPGVLERLIRDRGITLKKAALSCGVERTFLYRMTTGSRRPNDRKIVEKICRGLMLSATEAAELSKAWEMDEVGPEVYETRMLVREMMNTLDEELSADFVDGPSAQPWRLLQISAGEEMGLSFLQGKLRVRQAFFAALVKEADSGGHARFFLQPDNPDLLFLLSHCCASFPDLKMEHLFCFENSKGDKSAAENLKLFRSILPLALHQGGYRPYYMYGSVDRFSDPALLLPYYLITGSCVLLLSPDASAAVVLRDRRQILWFTDMFDRLLENSRLLLRVLGAAESVMRYLVSDGYSGMLADDCYMFNAQPSVIEYATPEIIRRLAGEPLSAFPGWEGILDDYIRVVTAARNGGFPGVCFFSREGISLLRRGVVTSSPAEFHLPVDIETFHHVLSEMEQDIRVNGRRLLMAKPQKLTPSAPLSFYCCRRSLTLMLAMKSAFRIVLLDESSIVQAMHDFAEYASTGDWVETQEDCLTFLREELQS